MKIDARVVVEEATSSLGISLADLIALSSIWAHPEVFQILRVVDGTWYPDRRRANLGLRVSGKQIEFVGQVLDGVTLDSNNYANVALKQALGVDRNEFIGFHVCHIWPGTVYNARYFTNIANLVAIPAELSSLTDHHPQIIECLKYRSWELYRWKPEEAPEPSRPESYPARWREPMTASDEARRAAARRVRSGAAPLSESHLVFPSAPRRQYLSGDDATDAALEAAFYLSKFDHERLGIGNQGETIDFIAAKLGVKRNTLKGYRDFLDSHTGSHREGWKVPLSPQLRAVFDRLRNIDERTLREKVLATVR